MDSNKEPRSLNATVRRLVWDKSGGQCWYCGCKLTLFDDWDDGHPHSHMQIDHIIPQQNGGGHGLENLAPACQSCNGSKGARSLEWFRCRLAQKQSGAPSFSKDQIDWLLINGFNFESAHSNVPFWFEKFVDERGKSDD